MTQAGQGGQAWRVSALYCAYFALVGGSSPYMALYFGARQMSIEQIGVLMTLPQLTRILAPPFWGWLADAQGGRLRVLRGSALAILAGIGLLIASGNTYPAMLVSLGLLSFAMSGQTPVAESMAIAIAGGDAGRYGRMRVWGSLGFIAAVAGLGPLLDRFGAATLPWWLAGLASLLVIVSRLARPPAMPARPASSHGGLRGRLRQPAVLAFLVSAFCMIFAHAALYAFFSLYLQQLGYSGTTIGLLWALGVLVEIALFWTQRPLFERFGALSLLSFSLLTAVARFGLVAGSGGWLPLIVVTQVLHAVTFGVHHSACMSLLQRWFAPHQQARAQAVFVTVAYGLGGAAGALACSWVWVHVSPQATFALASAAAGIGWLAVALCRRLDYSAGRHQQAGSVAQ